MSAGEGCSAPQREHRAASLKGSPGRPSACASPGEEPRRRHLCPPSTPPFSSVCQHEQASPERSRDRPTCAKVGSVTKGEVRTRRLAERRGSSTRVRARVRAALPSDHPVHSARIDGRRNASRSKSILVMQHTAERMSEKTRSPDQSRQVMTARWQGLAIADSLQLFAKR
jgi:hypothetical protein